MLFYLYYHILRNEYRQRFFSKSTALGAVIIIIISLFSAACGYGLGYIVSFGGTRADLFGGDPFYFGRIFFLEITLPFLLAKTSGSRNLKQINLKTLQIFPVTKPAIFIFDINTGLMDFGSPLFTVFLLGLTAGAGGFSVSLYAAVLLVVLILSLVYFVHVLGELFHSIIRLLGSLPKFRTSLRLTSGIILLYFIFLHKPPWHFLVMNNPLSWNVSSIFSLSVFNETRWVLNVILLNTLFSALCLTAAVGVKIFHADLFSAHVLQKTKAVNDKKISLAPLLTLFPAKLRPYLTKDFKYIFRSSRSISSIMLELAALAYVSYMHLTKAKHFDLIYLPAALVIIVPSLLWSFYQDNAWGLEKKGFGFYLYSSADFNILPVSKNLSLIIARFPVIIISSLVLGFLFSFKYMPAVILIYIVMIMVSFLFSNVISVRNPFPVEFKESSMSKKKQQNVSLLGTLGMTADMFIPAAMIFLLFIAGAGLLFYSVISAFIILLLFIYKSAASYTSVLLNRQKETIYKKLIKI